MSEPEVTPLRLAELTLPDFHPGAPGTDEVFAFLVRDGSECVLVDTGVGAGNTLIDRLYSPQRTDLGEALAAAGASIGDVTAVVNSHLHFDHCGNNARFPGIPIFVQRAEWDAFRQPHYTVPEWVDFPGADYRILEGRYALTPRLELIPTPGHTPGHQSLLVRTERGSELVVAQASYTSAEYESFHAASFEEPEGHWDVARYVDSLATLRDLGSSRVYFSHDARVWEGPPE